MHVIIPARFGSTRLPGKPLADVAGRPLIVRVYERALLSGAESVTVATDDERIADVIKNAGGTAIMTAKSHASGTDRIAEAADCLKLSDEDVVVNLQGDEPLMTPMLLRAVADALVDRTSWSMATVAHPIVERADFENPHIVKVVCADDGRALYFSRAPIPFPRSEPSAAFGLRHIGLYAYRVAFLKKFVDLGVGVLEEREGLEQLRVLAAGIDIGVVTTDEAPAAGVDTPEDLERVRARWAKSE